eukprot:PITA_20920
MAFTGLRLEYVLDGSSNYIAWKDSMEVVLEDNGIKDYIVQDVPKPSDATQRKLALKDTLRKIKCEKGNTITTFLNKLTNCRNELASIGFTTTDDDMVSLTLLGLPKRWHSYQDSVKKRDKLPDCERLWSNLMQEEIRRSIRDGSSPKHDDEENLALASKAKKGKGKESQSKSSQGGKKFDKSKVRCYHCHELGHYATNCPKKKSKKGSSKESDGDKNIFNTLEEKDIRIRIEMGDDRKYHVSGEGTVVFQREHGSPLTLSNVMYVPGLKNNLVSISMLEDKGYDVVSSLGKIFLRHIGIGQTKQIGIRIKNIYKLHVEDCVALSTKAKVTHGQDIEKLWHRRLGNLHHGALKIMQ